MADKHLHIISHFSPRPFDYEGGSDLFWMVKSLITSGIKIHLHLYCEKEFIHNDLINNCAEVLFYKRNTGHKGISIGIPYSVSSRADKTLIFNLERDLHPILFEGIQSSFFMYQGYFKNRKILIRLQCSQKMYFQELNQIHPTSIKKIATTIEGSLCGVYEKVLIKTVNCNTISKNIADELERCSVENIKSIIPQFIGMAYPSGLEGNGSFCLFHGRLSEKATEIAALWLLNNVFNTLELPLVIAGEKPSAMLEDAAHRQMHTCLVTDPTEKEMTELIKKAQLNILPSFVSHGSDNAILQSIMLGRHVVTNRKLQTNANFGDVLYYAEDPKEFIETTKQLFDQPFTQNDKDLRESYLNKEYNDLLGAKELLKLLY